MRQAWSLAEANAPVRFARHVAARTLAAWRLPDLCEPATLLVSELVTNALQHGAPPIELAMSLLPPHHAGGVQIEVRDAATAMPVRRDGDQDGGFGLTVAAALAELSYHPQRTGKVVRAVLYPQTPAPSAGFAAGFADAPPPQGHACGDPAPVCPLIDSPEGKTYVDLIEIDGLRLRCLIGCRDEERRDLSDVVINLRIGADTRPAATSDTLEDAWNYRTPVKTIIGHVEASAYRTVEALATAIARILIVEHRAPYARVRVRKPGALRFADTAGVTIERTTADFPDTSPGAEPQGRP